MIPARYLPALILFTSPGTSTAQPIETDRPDQTEASWTIPQSTLQVEFGSELRLAAGGDADSVRIAGKDAGVLMRLALTAYMELRFGLAFRSRTVETSSGQGADRVSAETEDGLTDVSAGVKIGMWQEMGPVPEASLIAHVIVPHGAEVFTPAHVTPAVRLAFSNTISDATDIGYNLGMEWADGLEEPSLVYTLAIGYAVTESVDVYGEVFGEKAFGGGHQASADAGLKWRPADSLQLDVSGGVGLTGEAPDYIGLGVSLRVPW